MWIDDEEMEYCFINVGRSAGKVKFCMLDRDNGWIGQKYSLRATLLTDTRTGEAAVHVLAFPKDPLTHQCADTQQVITIQQLVWQTQHSKTLCTGQSLHHINGNTMDNRIDNLSIEKTTPSKPHSVDEKITTSSSSSIYSLCINQLVSSLPWMNVPDCLSTFCDNQTTVFSKQQETHSANNQPAYYECHYLACTNLERRRLQFDSCGGCRSVRYCSSECQWADWAIHKPHCDLIQHLSSQSQHSLHTQAYDKPLSSPCDDLMFSVER